MKTLFKILFIGTALMILAAMFGGFALLNHHGSDMHITMGGDELFIGSGDFGDWVGATLGLFIAGLVLCLVVPLVLLLGVALPLVICAFVVGVVLVAVLGVGAVLGSPLILLGLLFFVVLRNRNRAARATQAEHRTEPV